MNRNLIGTALMLSLGLAACSAPTPTPTPSPVGAPVPATDFDFSVTPTSVAVQAQGAAELSAALTRRGGFADPVTLTLLNPPAGLSAAAVTVPAGASAATLTLKASSASVPGEDTLTFAADSGGLHKTVQVKVNVAAAPVPADQAALTLVATHGSLTLKTGQPTPLDVKVTRSHFTGPVTLHLDHLPANVTAADVVLDAGQDSGQLILTQTGKGVAGTSTIRVQATAGVVSAQLNVPLTVQSVANPLTVVGTSPVDGAQGVPSDAVVEAQFSRVLQEVEGQAQTVSVTPAVDKLHCFVKRDAANAPMDSLQCQGAFVPDTTYTVTLGSGIKAADGAPLAQPHTFSFHTALVFTVPPFGDLTPPTVTDFTPVNGRVGVEHGPLSITVNFSEPMNRAATQNAFQLVVPNVTDSQKGFSWNASSTVMTMTYKEVLPYGTTVIWGMSNAATDLAGNPLAQALNVGGTYRLMRQNTMKLYGNKTLSFEISHQPGDDELLAHTVGEYPTQIGRARLVDFSRYWYMRAFLQFPLGDLLGSLPLGGKITKINSAVLNIYTAGNTGNPGLLGQMNAVNIATPFLVQAGALWNAPEANSGQTLRHVYQTPGPAIGYHTLDITVPFSNNLKNPDASGGMSQWRIQREFDDNPLNSNFNPNSTEIGDPSDKDVNKRPFIQVTYEYP